MYVYIFKLFIPPVKQKKVYIYKHFKELKSKKKPKFKKKNHINNQTYLPNIQNTKKYLKLLYIKEKKYKIKKDFRDPKPNKS